MRKSILVLLHLAYWMVYSMLVAFLFLALPATNRPPLLQALFLSKITVFAILPGLLGFYSFYTVLFDGFLRQKKFLSLIFAGLLASVICGLLALLTLYFVSGPRYVFHDGWSQAFAETVFLSLLALVHGVIALVMKGFITWYTEIRQKEELNKKNNEMELALIKAQINPHFLFNTINNIDVLIEKDAARASVYLNKLSGIMRFMLYETKTGKIALEKELTYIGEYLDLQKIRTSNPDFVHYSLEGDTNDIMIEPMLFIPFIENAFKHAENKKMEGAIDIRFVVEKGRITFDCENRYSRSIESKNYSGLGNELIKKRLLLLYPGKHKLEITAENETYHAKLILDHSAN